MSQKVLEICVDSTASAMAARAGGADRLELCADLAIGGTTPSLALVQQVKAETGLPVRALLRPRMGDFCYDRWELAQMEVLAADLVRAGADGIVTGVLTPDGALDVSAMERICDAARQAAQGRPVLWPSIGLSMSAGMPPPVWKRPVIWDSPRFSPAGRPPMPIQAGPCWPGCSSRPRAGLRFWPGRG